MTTFTLDQLRGRTNEGQPIGADHRPTPTEEVHWCATCGAIGAGTAPHPAATATARQLRMGTAPTCDGTARGATIPAPMDGPGAMANPRRTFLASLNGTGHNVKPDVTPGIMARGSFPARTTARRAGNGAKVKRYRLTVHGAATARRRSAAQGHAWGQGAGQGAYRLRGALPDWNPARDFTAPQALNADGTVPKVVKRQRRSRAAILAATGRTDARRPARRPAALTSL